MTDNTRQAAPITGAASPRHPVYTAKFYREAARLIDSGLSYQQVADQLGVSKPFIDRVSRDRRWPGGGHMEAEIVDLDFPISIHRCLFQGGYQTIAQLRAATDQELLGLRNFGRERLAVVRRVLGPPAPHGSDVYHDEHDQTLSVQANPDLDVVTFRAGEDLDCDENVVTITLGRDDVRRIVDQLVAWLAAR